MKFALTYILRIDLIFSEDQTTSKFEIEMNSNFMPKFKF